VTDREVAESVPGASPLDREHNARILAPGCGEIDLHGVRASGQTSRGNRCDVRARAERALSFSSVRTNLPNPSVKRGARSWIYKLGSKH
jgi:hypothetical protein